MNADTIAMLVELGLIVALIPALIITIREEIRLRRIRRKIATIATQFADMSVAMRGLGRAADAAIPTLQSLAAALKPFADAVGTTITTEETP